MKKIYTELEKFRLARNIDEKEFNLTVEKSSLLKEVTEYLDAQAINDVDEMVDALCDISVFAINGARYLGYRGVSIHFLAYTPTIDDIAMEILKLNNGGHIALGNIVSMCFTILEKKLGYNPEKCMLECIKEISSREQDPEQKRQWELNGPSGKWEKDKKQDPYTIYSANYAVCKIENEHNTTNEEFYGLY